MLRRMLHRLFPEAGWYKYTYSRDLESIVERRGPYPTSETAEGIERIFRRSSGGKYEVKYHWRRPEGSVSLNKKEEEALYGSRRQPPELVRRGRTKPPMTLLLTCRQENVDQVVSTIRELLSQRGKHSYIVISDVYNDGSRIIMFHPGIPYTKQDACKIFDEPVYKALFQSPGVLRAKALSWKAFLEMTAQEAVDLAEQMINGG